MLNFIFDTTMRLYGLDTVSDERAREEGPMAIKGVRARLSLLGPEDGGRHFPVPSGYLWPLNFEPWQSYSFNDGKIVFVGRDSCLPGESCLAEIVFVAPAHVPVQLRQGVPFQMNEGPRTVIGSGEILDLLYD
jgi:hypothetical protein